MKIPGRIFKEFQEQRRQKFLEELQQKKSGGIPQRVLERFPMEILREISRRIYGGISE